MDRKIDKRELIIHHVMHDYWDVLYRNKVTEKKFIHEVDRVLHVFKQEGVNGILDVGCGRGETMLYLARHGFEVHGMDFSKEALKNIPSRHDIEIQIADMHATFPYPNDYFDAITCLRTINHGTGEEIVFTITELERVLKKDGLLFLTIRNHDHGKRVPFEKVASRTFIPEEGDEKGIIHFEFDETVIKKFFKNFKIITLEVIHGPEEWASYYHVLGRLTPA